MYFSYGVYPWGAGWLSADGSPRYVAWAAPDAAPGWAASPDGRLWYVSRPNAYGSVDPVTEHVATYHTPRSLSVGQVASGPGGDVSFTSGDNLLYVIETGATLPPIGVAPSSLASALPTPSEAFGSVVVVVTSATLAAGATMFVTFPAQLFNLTLDENYGTISAWWERWRRRLRVPAKGTSQAQRREQRVFGVVVAVGALLGGLLDPTFGSGLGSLASYLAIVLALITGAAVIGGVTSTYHRLHGRRPSVHLRGLPLGLLTAAACVLVSRALSFQPGYLYGVVCGVVFSRTLSDREHAHVAALGALATLIVAVIAWVAWVPVQSAAKDGAFLLVLLDNFLAAVFVSGMVSTAIGLLPLRLLPGGVLSAWSRTLWLGLYVATMFGVVDVVIRTAPQRGGNHSALGLTIALFLLFGAVAVGFREFFARRWRREHGVEVRGFRAWVTDIFTGHPSRAGDTGTVEAADAARRTSLLP